MEHAVKVTRREPLTVVAKRVPVTIPEIGGVLGPAFGEVYGYLGAHGVEPEGPPFVVYHGMPEGDRPFDIEICAPVARVIDPPDGWQTRVLPGGEFATLVHVGPYDTVGAAYESLGAWIAEHDLAIVGPPREVYMSEPDTPPERIATIVEFPVERVTEPVATG
jgi:effector-binding domain-containing protein